MRNSDITIKEICEILWQFEKDTGVLNLEIQGVKIWQLIRFKIFEEVTQKLGVYEKAHTTKNGLKHKIVSLPKIICNAIHKNPLRGKYTKEILIFDHPRKVKADGEYIDIYTYYFINGFRNDEIEVIEKPYLWRHFSERKSANRKYTDAIILDLILKKFLYLRQLNKNEIKTLIELENELLKIFNLKIELVERVKREIKSFMIQFDYYNKLLKKRKPSEVYLVVSYGKHPLVAAAKFNNIEVIEFQHGVITNYHFAYNFSDPTKKIEYFPDKLLTFGEYWAKTEGFPKQTKVEVYGFPYLNRQLEKYKTVTKRKKQVLFISQGTIGKDLSKIALELARALPEYYFIYKLHPGEYDRWKFEYIDLIAASNLSNFVVIDNNEKNLYHCFAEAEYQIGVYSTAIFEGLTLNCKTILFNLPGIEYMADLIKQDIVEVANDSEEAIRYIKNYNTKEFSRDYFFKEPQKKY